MNSIVKGGEEDWMKKVPSQANGAGTLSFQGGFGAGIQSRLPVCADTSGRVRCASGLVQQIDQMKAKIDSLPGKNPRLRVAEIALPARGTAGYNHSAGKFASAKPPSFIFWIFRQVRWALNENELEIHEILGGYMKNRFTQLDGMRGIAIILVVLYHYTTRFQNIYGHPRPLLFYVPLGLYGVQLFFIISGFVIFMTLERTNKIRDFIVSRFSRLFPAYWASVLLTFTTVHLFSLPGRQVSFATALVNLSMLQEWLGVPHVDGVYWTLTIELSFYAIMLVLFKKIGNIKSIAAGWMGFMVITFMAQKYFAIAIPKIVGTSLLLSYGNLFIAGIMFYKLHNKERDLSMKALLVCALIIDFIIHGLISGLFCLSFFILFFLTISGFRAVSIILTMKPLLFVGTISYSLYLLHQNIGYAILRALYAKNINPVVAIPITILSSLMLATCVNTLIEVPAKERIRAYWKSIND